MNKVNGSNVHRHITVVFDWEMAAVVSLSFLIRLLLQVAGGLGVHSVGPFARK